ncbi:MAG TPA: sugar ABC transporter ATP-binding protein [Thermotogota bacterium]|nr:sugar ABC transporter ATP-binding protein [Thermotogota bacterium]HRW92194.1 sugar ABC transporter ATP-binding protein [Thermotogota bacterium]
MSPPLLKVEGLSKEFSGVRVLDKVSFELQKGEILGIIGENGAGKSTLIKIISGIYRATEGEVFFEGTPADIQDPRDAMEKGISTIPQEFNLIPDLNVFENIFLGKEYRKVGGLLDKRRMVERTDQLLSELQTSVSPTEMIQDLSVAQKQMVEFAKALAYQSKLLIMDEPTTVLTGTEIKVLFEIMEQLRNQGVGIIYISHKLKEVKTICDRVLILRDGEMITIDETDALSEHQMATLMVGRELSQVFPEKNAPSAETVMQVEDLAVPGLLEGISFSLKKGEILGFSGLVGSGRTELAEAIIGIRKKSRGKVRIHGKDVHIRSPRDAVKNKIAYLSEDRQGIGVLTNFGIVENISLVSLPNYSRFLIQHGKERKKAAYYVKEFNIRAASLKTRLEFFSGGNQQKVSLAKSLDPEPSIFIIDEPTRGIDVNAKREIYHFIHSLVQKGISCILISSEMEEIIGMSNRVVVMREGKITGILEGEQINEPEIMFHATGLKGVA